MGRRPTHSVCTVYLHSCKQRLHASAYMKSQQQMRHFKTRSQKTAHKMQVTVFRKLGTVPLTSHIMGLWLVTSWGRKAPCYFWQGPLWPELLLSAFLNYSKQLFLGIEQQPCNPDLTAAPQCSQGIIYHS